MDHNCLIIDEYDESLRKDINDIKTHIDALHQEITTLRQDVTALTQEIITLHQENNALTREITILRQEMKNNVSTITDVNKIVHDIYNVLIYNDKREINKNIRLYTAKHGTTEPVKFTPTNSWFNFG